MKKHTALYTRVSTEAQAEEGYSIEAQKKLLEAFCISKEIQNFKFYTDAGYSGSNLDRPAINELIGEIKAGRVQSVAVYKLDRLSRSQKDTLFLIEDVFNPNGVGFISLSENMDTSTPIGRAMLGIMSAFAQLERETIKMRTRMGMKERVKSGLWMGGGKIPFGYDYDKNSGKLIKNADSETVKKIYEMYLDGKSPAFIANALGLKYDKLVFQILKRKTNTGVISYKGEEYEGQHEALVDKEVFEKAQKEIKTRSKKSYSTSHLLSGLIFCGKCGARMRYQKWGEKGYKLVCYSQQKYKPYLVHDPDCDAKRVWAEDVEAEVLKDVFELNLKRHDKENKKNNTTTLLENKNRLERKLARLYTLFSDGDDTLVSVIENVKEQLEKTNEMINEEKKEKEKNAERKATFEKAQKLVEIWDTLTDDEKKKVINSIVEKIVVWDNKIEIHYAFDL